MPFDLITLPIYHSPNPWNPMFCFYEIQYFSSKILHVSDTTQNLSFSGTLRLSYCHNGLQIHPCCRKQLHFLFLLAEFYTYGYADASAQRQSGSVDSTFSNANKYSWIYKRIHHRILSGSKLSQHVCGYFTYAQLFRSFCVV